ncbi:hypothetical protein MPTK1_4g16522 [Marchantia polymorpha subsp. ruderalis]|uniref:Uncharacterized protein n=2 Tax=Marchantia polymorpha TaxID=3197 RepID=A0A679E025_MARPO|nr:hypothetical protein MARPO_1426s0001 [Marchantia polymorpha]BBN20703.1 hypothetical protein Mp_zg00340 [Marchantia polymorpha subsp. ruderalis]|eukprot:PTQ26482.1 hypothetical protein MARPO_1426s0001 [Marchantia polymorpha]
MSKEQQSSGTPDLLRRSSSRAMTGSSKISDPLLPTSSAQESDPLLQRGGARAGNGSEVVVADKNNPWANLVNGLYSGASNLTNLLPTGTFLAFTAIAPIITDNGTCDDAFELNLTIVTIVFFALFCVFSCFTDSYQAADGQVYYGIVTLKGLWTPQLPVVLHPGDKEQYKLTFIDVVHAVLSLAVFAACSLMTPNIRACLYPKLQENVVRIVPAFVGFFVSAVFVALPTTRHGIGFPVSPASFSFASRDAAAQLRRELQAADSTNGGTGTSSTSLGPKKE